MPELRHTFFVMSLLITVCEKRPASSRELEQPLALSMLRRQREHSHIAESCAAVQPVLLDEEVQIEKAISPSPRYLMLGDFLTTG